MKRPMPTTVVIHTLRKISAVAQAISDERLRNERAFDEFILPIDPPVREDEEPVVERVHRAISDTRVETKHQPAFMILGVRSYLRLACETAVDNVYPSPTRDALGVPIVLDEDPRNIDRVEAQREALDAITEYARRRRQ